MAWRQTGAAARPLASGATEAADADPRSLELFTLLARTGLFLDALQGECLAGHGLSFAEFSVLRLLQAAPGRRLPPTRLAERIVRTTGGLTKLVDRLERVGLVVRAADPSDRRGVLVRLTPAGNRSANAAARSYTDGRARVLSRLEPGEVRRATAGLRRLLEVMETDRMER